MLSQDLSQVSNNTALEKRPGLSRAVFDACVMRVLASRNEPAPIPQVLNIWYIEARNMGFTDERFKEATIAVVRSKPFGVTKFAEWCENIRLYTEYEVEELILKAIDGKLNAFGFLNREALRQEQMREMSTNVFRTLEAFRDELRQEVETRLDRVREWYNGADEISQRRVADMVKLKRPALANDPFWPEHWKTMTRMCLADVLDEVEHYAKLWTSR